MRALSILIAVLLFSTQVFGATKEQMYKHVLKIGENVEINRNMISFSYRGVPETIVFDENANRMRIISPIIEVRKVDNALLLNALEANFHSVLDARYAVSEDLVWSAFIHPLDDLSITLLDSAISQVAIANVTFGQEFTSGTVFFPSGN